MWYAIIAIAILLIMEWENKGAVTYEDDE